MKKLFVALLILVFIITSCDVDRMLIIGLLFTEVAQLEHDHIHSIVRGLKVNTKGTIAASHLADDGKNVVAYDLGSLDKELSRRYPHPLIGTNKKYLEKMTTRPAAIDPFYDHGMDGVYVGTLVVTMKPEPFVLSRIDVPFVVCFNTSSKDNAYASFNFLNYFETIEQKKQVWQTSYIDSVDVKLKSSGTITKNYDVSMAFDPKLAKSIVPLTKKADKVKFTLKGSLTVRSGVGDLVFSTITKSSGYKPEFTVLPFLRRITESKGLQGIWITGYEDSFFVRNSDDTTTNVGTFYVPVTLTIFNTTTTPVSGTENWFTMLFGMDTFGYQKIKGSNIVLSKTEKPRDGYSLDLKKTKKETLEGKMVYYDVWGVEFGKKYKYAFRRAGFGGKKVRVKKVAPNTVSLAKVNKVVTLKISGTNFAPGAMVHFSHPDLELRSVKWENKKSLKVQVAATKAIKKGTRIGIRVDNPDTISGSKNGILKAK